ncbi:MAG: Phosphoribosylformylglycinamidine cyclo-ligase [Alphaproteobacteria bacterium MarineAlpha8_Bin1]|nr:MAG: Phosphoribosylformylglycinamidine cyclo-ligase [Alphaproteobacteria bacterium MarineAlpha8_Bin1]
MCVNDLLASGGEPLFFLDYLSSSKIEEKLFLDLISSINLACKESNCSLVGGETAEMPGMYKKGDFDLAGFSVGVVERSNLLSRDKVKNDSIIIGLESSGFHSNGYSLIRKVIKNSKIKLSDPPPYKSIMNTLGDDLLIPTKIYVKDLLPLIKKKLISSIAHITGGGIFENLSRIVPKHLKSTIDTKKFKIPEKFIWIKEEGKIKKVEMLKTFNCGIGMILIIDKKNKKNVFDYLSKKKINYHLLGIVEKTKLPKSVEINNFGIWDLI